MHRLVRVVLSDSELGDLSSLVNPDVVDELRAVAAAEEIQKKLLTAKDAKERKGKQSPSLVIKIPNLVIPSDLTLALTSLASLSVLCG